MRDRHRQRQVQQDVAQAEPDLQHQRSQQRAGVACQAMAEQLRGERQQRVADRQRAGTVGEMDRRARFAVELAAQVIRADLLAEVKTVGEVRLRPPFAMAGRQVDAGHRGVVGTDPAAQGDLPDHQRQSGGGQPAQMDGQLGARGEGAGQAQRQQE